MDNWTSCWNIHWEFPEIKNKETTGKHIGMHTEKNNMENMGEKNHLQNTSMTLEVENLKQWKSNGWKHTQKNNKIKTGNILENPSHREKKPNKQ